MSKKILVVLLVISLLVTVAACTKNDGSNDALENEPETPSITGIQLGDHKDKVIEILGEDYSEKYYEEPGHFPEAYSIMNYEEGFEIVLGQDSQTVLHITATAPTAETNLGIKIGDTAEKALEVYRAKYIEPESIHGGKLFGVFKVENGQALIFDFNIEDGIINPPEEIKAEEKVERIILTYPAYLDDSF
ncbi:MAG: hypothetical protein GXY91_04080 [Clostridia bacterium]|nr:hypothetical protein [Clostridia bacterium]